MNKPKTSGRKDEHAEMTEDSGTHIAIVNCGGQAHHAWVRPTRESALQVLRRWYAIRLAVHSLNIDEEDWGAPVPAQATPEEITGWFAASGEDFSVTVIAAKDDPLDLELEGIAYLNEKRELYLQRVLESVAQLDESLNAAEPSEV